MPSQVEAMSQWHEFYTLLGTASATMVGLLFVATTVGSGVFSSGRRAPLRIFLSASVINFSSVLVASLVVVAPGQSWESLGVMIALCGVFGLAYYGVVTREAIRDGLIKSVDLEDRTWYGVLPVIVYLFETACGVAVAMHLELGCVALAVSMGLLLVIGIHNAWDITVWTMTRRRDAATETTGEQTSSTETTSDG
jgi:hypothetical protein